MKGERSNLPCFDNNTDNVQLHSGGSGQGKLLSSIFLNELKGSPGYTVYIHRRPVSLERPCPQWLRASCSSFYIGDFLA